MRKATIGSIQEGLRRLGMGTGDTVYLKADLRMFGLELRALQTELLEAFLDVVGTNGTIATSTYTPMFPIAPPFRRVPRDHVFDQNSRTNSGALASLFLMHPRHIRSAHPTCSIAAIGANAERLCAGHDASAPAYQPMQTVIDLRGKLLMAGCLATNPGFHTVHWAQYELGLARRTFLSGRLGTYYRDGDTTRLFRRRDFGGCSAGFGKFYAHYIAQEKLAIGEVGAAYSVAIAARDAYEIDRAVLERDPRFALCDNPGCFYCRFAWGYNARDRPGFILRRLGSLASRAGRRSRGAAAPAKRPTEKARPEPSHAPKA